MAGTWFGDFERRDFVKARRLLDKSQGKSSFSLLEQTPPVPFVE
jgi:hypothetical protein